MPYSGPFGIRGNPHVIISEPDGSQNCSIRLVDDSARFGDVLRWLRQNPEARKLKLEFDPDRGAFPFPARQLRNLTDLLISNGLPFTLEPRKDYLW